MLESRGRRLQAVETDRTFESLATESACAVIPQRHFPLSGPLTSPDMPATHRSAGLLTGEARRYTRWVTVGVHRHVRLVTAEVHRYFGLLTVPAHRPVW
jgi:hypothetical protein